ncbi:hypothetical protein [Neptuniibacter sp. QD34_54]|uniref:hypothetical protein n=1 Tax=Neptuniibacter sp. QD34_54 TaxID=3398208 RepID=UPI0039F4F71B
MGSVINPSIFKAVYDKIVTEGQQSSSGFFLRGVYAAGQGKKHLELKDCFSRIRVVNGEVVATEFSNNTQRVRFLNKVRKLYCGEQISQ